jgi:hypothetical protein
MQKKVVGVIVGVGLVVLLGGVVFLATDDGGDDRKAAIGAQGGKPDLPPGRAVSADQAPDRSARGQSEAPPAAAKALAAMQRRIANFVDRSGTDKSFASYVDGDTGRIVLITDASESEVAQVTDVADADDRREIARGRIQRGVTTRDVWHRRDDIQPFWGGAGIAAGGSICSAGYAARNGAGTVFSVTAGHCWANGTTVSVESGARTFGTVSNRRLPTVTGHAMDVELVGGQTYAGRIYTGGVTSTSSIPVVAAGSAFAGYSNYCHSGRTTGQSCGHTATSTTGQVCTQTGCKSPVIVFTGGTMIQPGDSGGTFYAADSSGAWIRGNTIASGGDTGYAQPWTVIASELGLSIVTG